MPHQSCDPKPPVVAALEALALPPAGLAQAEEARSRPELDDGSSRRADLAQQRSEAIGARNLHDQVTGGADQGSMEKAFVLPAEQRLVLEGHWQRCPILAYLSTFRFFPDVGLLLRQAPPLLCRTNATLLPSVCDFLGIACVRVAFSVFGVRGRIGGLHRPLGTLAHGGARRDEAAGPR